jgi:hypothetical protein
VSDQRRSLSFASEDEAIADVTTLRRGYTRSGAWTLPQICWHLDQTIQMRMKPGPFPPNTPEQDARREILQDVLSTGKLPSGIVAPDAIVPAPDCGEQHVGAFLATLEKFKSFPGPIAPHRLFGHLSDADARRLNLIHVAHHLSYLTPKD